MPDRSMQPQIKEIERLRLQEPRKVLFNNGIPVYIVSGTDRQALRIECVFRSGSWEQKHPLVANFCVNMLPEGTRSYTSAQIADQLEFYGAFMSTDSDKHRSSLTIHGLKKHLPAMTDILREMLTEPVFPEKEFNVQVNRRKQGFIIEMEKPRFHAKKAFFQALYGNRHPYGSCPCTDNFDALDTSQLRDYYHNNLTSSKLYLICAGDVDDAVLAQLEAQIGTTTWGSVTPETLVVSEAVASEQVRHYIERPNQVQSAIYVGKPLFNRLHPDYFTFKVLNTVLGGYFGSRLMSRIREEKGYTYGIRSQTVSYLHGGYFAVITDTGTEYTPHVLTEIRNEIERLRNELINPDELHQVKRYLLGDLVRMYEGCFAQADALEVLLEYNLNYEYTQQYFDAIIQVNAEQLRQAAQQYLDTQTMYEVVAGKM